MAAFAYSAINAHGFSADGEIHAPSADAAREQLRIRGLLAERLIELPSVGEDGVRTTFKKIKPEQLGGPSSEPDKYDALVQDLVGVVTHVSTHTGQILWITKMLREGELDEVWIRAHKRHGGWRAK